MSVGVMKIIKKLICINHDEVYKSDIDSYPWYALAFSFKSPPEEILAYIHISTNIHISNIFIYLIKCLKDWMKYLWKVEMSKYVMFQV